MNEFELIARLRPLLPGHPSVVVPAGDDCAVVDLGQPHHFQLLKTDAVVEGIHFTPETEPERIGHKALARCFSDIAAMAGMPLHALITLALPQSFDPARIEAIYRGMAAIAQRYGVAIVGGETTTNPDRMLLAITVTGTCPRGRLLLRGGAKPGDAIFVTGDLGGSILGKHLDFEPRLHEAQWLAEHFTLHALTDLSDGLASDLRHILDASGVGADLLASAIPISQAARRRARQVIAGDVALPLSVDTQRSALLGALTDGEDFELLFTLSSAQAVPLLDAWKIRFPNVQLSCIGRTSDQPGLRLRDAHGVRPLNVHGYTHFQSS